MEREGELARFDRVFDRVGAGLGAVVVVQGAAGIGKSELLAAVGVGAQARGFGLLSARGSEFETEIAFGVARQLFEPMLRVASPVRAGVAVTRRAQAMAAWPPTGVWWIWTGLTQLWPFASGNRRRALPLSAAFRVKKTCTGPCRCCRADRKT